MQESGVEERSQEKGQEGKKRIRCLGVSSTQGKDSSKTHCEKALDQWKGERRQR